MERRHSTQPLSYYLLVMESGVWSQEESLGCQVAGGAGVFRVGGGEAAAHLVCMYSTAQHVASHPLARPGIRFLQVVAMGQKLTRPLAGLFVLTF